MAKLPVYAEIIGSERIHEFVNGYEERRLELSEASQPRPLEHLRLIELVTGQVLLPAYGSDDRIYESPLTKKGPLKDRLEEIFDGQGIDPNTRRSLLQSAGAIARGLVRQTWLELRQARQAGLKEGLKDKTVKGDPRHTDPKLGASGVGGSHLNWMNPDMDPNGASEQTYNLDDA